ncbi:MAG: hypothetical protein II864_01510 [Prevotella sp.]|nr:hypothetical protein [Prevotella sp.]
MKVKWLLGLLGLACCLVVSARDGVRMLAPFGDELHFSDENILSGDVNGDGRVDMVDVVLTIRHLTGASSEEFPERAADVNMDGFLTAADIPLIVNIILRGGCPDAHHPHMIDLGLPSGTKWACCNVGATSPETSGRYYSWGMCYENNPYLYNWDMYPYGDYNDKGDDKDYSQMVDIGSDIAGTDYDVALRTWGEPWRMPSLDQCRELIDNTTSVWIQQDGIYGRRFTGRNGCSIFIPAAGDRFYFDLMFDGTSGIYWTSTLVEDYPCAAYYFGFSSNSVYNDYYYRYSGRSVRPVCQ